METPIKTLLSGFLPNYQKMVLKTIYNENLLYYPTDKDSNTEKIKIFEFEDTQILRQKKKAELLKHQEASLGKKAVTQNETANKNQPRKKQTIEISHDWHQIMEFNKQSLEKLKLDSEVNISSGAM